MTADPYSATSRPHVLILGRAKTGTTFIAKSIEASCPAKPLRFIMEPKTLRDMQQARAASTRSTIIMKVLFDDWITQRDNLDELAGGDAQPAFHTRIAILRDPRDELISRLMYRPFSFLLSGHADDKDVERWATVLEQREQNHALTFFDMHKEYTAIFLGESDPANEINDVARLCLEYANYLNQCQGAFVTLRYEDAVLNDFSAIEKTLGWNVSQTRDLGRFGYTKRSSSSKNWMKWFHASDLERIKELMEPACKGLGYNDWALPADIDRTIEPEHHSGYVRALTLQYRQQSGALRTFVQRLRSRLFS